MGRVVRSRTYFAQLKELLDRQAKLGCGWWPHDRHGAVQEVVDQRVDTVRRPEEVAVLNTKPNLMYELPI